MLCMRLDIKCLFCLMQGRYDVCCPMMSAWDLHKAWPEADFRVRLHFYFVVDIYTTYLGLKLN